MALGSWRAWRTSYRSQRAALLWVGLAILGGLASPPAAAATELDDFERARRAYEQHDYRLAVDLFEQMVGGPTPAIRNPLLVEECRKYLAAAYVFVGNPDAAEQQFAALLQSRPDYSFNPATFPAPVVDLFESVRERLARERVEAAAERERRQADRAAARREAQLRLIAMAEEAEVTLPNDPLLAWLPFGVGQFQNGNAELGAALLLSQALTLLASVATFVVWMPVNDLHQSQGRLSTVDPDLLLGLQIANWASLGAFGILAAAGILEAHLRFVPARTVRQPREVPADLLEQLDLTLGPSGVGLRLMF